MSNPNCSIISDFEYVAQNVQVRKACWWYLLLTIMLKELEHRKLGWKVLILKYDLRKSLSKEMWSKMADTS